MTWVLSSPTINTYDTTIRLQNDFSPPVALDGFGDSAPASDLEESPALRSRVPV